MKGEEWQEEWKINSSVKEDLVSSVSKKRERQPLSFRVTEAPFKETEQQELNSPALLFEEHNKERVLRSADVSSLFTQGMVKVRGITRTRKERRDMEV